MEINNNSSFKTDWDKLRGVIRGGGGGDYRGFAIFVQLYCVCVCVCVMECYTGAFNLTRNDPHRSTTDQPSHRLFSPIHLGRRRRRRLHPTGPKCCRSLIKKKNRQRPPGDPAIDLLARTICWSVATSSVILIVLIQISMYVWLRSQCIHYISDHWTLKKGAAETTATTVNRSISQELVTIFLGNASSFFGWHTVTRDLVTIEIESTPLHGCSLHTLSSLIYHFPSDFFTQVQLK